MNNPLALPARLVQRLRPLLLCAALLAGHGAGAKDMETAQALWLQGQREQALAAVQSALGQNPNNAQLRFAQAVMQMEMGQTAKAEAGLQSLTQDFPDLADPYNNLAVLYAARGDLELARGALEQAVRMQPEHAQAQENLGDVMLRLAARAYQRALQHSHGDTSALQLKLSRTQALQGAPSQAGR